MIKKLLLFLILAAGIAGCSTANTSEIFSIDHPGRMNVANGELQLFFSNPDYSSEDPWSRREYIENRQLYGSKGGFPAVTGGIGMMQVWRF